MTAVLSLTTLTDERVNKALIAEVLDDVLVPSPHNGQQDTHRVAQLRATRLVTSLTEETVAVAAEITFRITDWGVRFRTRNNN